MSTTIISQYVRAICNPDNFKTLKSLHLEFNSNGSPIMFQNKDVVSFKMYCSDQRRFLALKFYLNKRVTLNRFFNKISVWHNRDKGLLELPAFGYLENELSLDGTFNRNVCISEWHDSLEANVSFNIENSVRIVDEVAFTADMTRLIAFPDPNNKRIESYAIPQGVTTIGEKAFEGCTQILEVVIPNTVTTIENEAFYCSYHIKYINIPDSITHIGAGAFSMIRMKTFHIPYNVRITGGYFIGCPELMTITLGKNHPHYAIVDDILFSHDKKKLLRYPPARLETSYVVPDGVEEIGSYAFSYCIQLKEIIIPVCVTSICEYAFMGTKCKTINFPENINFAGEGIFDESANLESFIFPSKLTKISSAMFMSCNALVNIEIPNHINSIEDYAFSYCENLTELNIPNSVISIGENAFAGCKKLTSVIIPHSVKSMGLSVFAGCDELEEIQFFGDMSIIEESTFENCINLKTILFPKGVSKIDKNAFSECNGLRSIVIPEGVTEIGIEAFYSCAELNSVILPNSLISIGVNAFKYCDKLVNIDLPHNVTFVGDNAFNGCENLNYGFKLALSNRFGVSVIGEEDDW